MNWLDQLAKSAAESLAAAKPPGPSPTPQKSLGALKTPQPKKEPAASQAKPNPFMPPEQNIPLYPGMMARPEQDIPLHPGMIQR